MLYLDPPCSLDDALAIIKELYEAPGDNSNLEFRIKPDGDGKFTVCMDNINSEKDAKARHLATTELIKEFRSLPLK